MKNFDYQVWSISNNGVLSRLAGFNSEDAAKEFKSQIAKQHTSSSTVVVVNGSELTSASQGSRV